MKAAARFLFFLLWATPVLAQGLAPADAALPPIDAQAIARRLMTALQPAAGERAVIFYDPAYYPELAQAVRAELGRAGVHPVALLAFDPPETVRAMAADRAGIKKREEEFISFLRPVFEKADIFLWLPAHTLYPDLRWEKLVGAGHARGIHFHWILPLEGKSAEEIRTLSRMYERAILESDYAALSAEQDRLAAGLRGQTIRITTPDGTDLRLGVPRDAWFHKNDGDMSPARAKQAESVRDREMEFPSGALRFIPDAASVEGKLVLPRLAGAEGITLEFERGRVVRWHAEKNEAAFRALWESIGGDVDKVGEIVLGTNPLLMGSVPSGDLPYYGYGAGYVRVSLGDNWESGGKLRSPFGRPLWLFLERPTLEAGGRVLIRDAQIVR